MAAPSNFGNNRNEERAPDPSGLRESRVITINRVAKVVKGGRRFAFAALVVVGDQKGRVGYGAGKAREVPEAIRKATDRAKKTMIRVPMKEGRTLHHDVTGHFGAGSVVLDAVAPFTTVVGIPARPVARTAGLAIAQTDYLVKTLGKKKIGLICATQAFGTQSCDAVKPAIEAAGGQVVSRQDADVDVAGGGADGGRAAVGVVGEEPDIAAVVQHQVAGRAREDAARNHREVQCGVQKVLQRSGRRRIPRRAGRRRSSP
mgnify:CR=1 FL=1